MKVRIIPLSHEVLNGALGVVIKDAHHVLAELDISRLRHDRTQNISFTQARRGRSFRINNCASSAQPIPQLQRTLPRHPFVPEDENEFAARAQEILNIQVPAKRPPKQLMFIPALLLLALVWFLQRGRKSKLEAFRSRLEAAPTNR